MAHIEVVCYCWYLRSPVISRERGLAKWKAADEQREIPVMACGGRCYHSDCDLWRWQETADHASETSFEIYMVL
jgi:hypothetical protein